ncbi:MAG: hypothetical protein J7J31_07185 [Helicobacteraceae bacterium]|nr:hypothetical protein [Helicobacteraceae bacterium]
MGVQEKIKEEILQEINTEIDKLYDSLHQRFILSDANHDLIIKELNRIKDQFYVITMQSKLS